MLGARRLPCLPLTASDRFLLVLHKNTLPYKWKKKTNRKLQMSNLRAEFDGKRENTVGSYLWKMMFLQTGRLGVAMNLVKTQNCSHFDNGLLSSFSWWNSFKLCQVLLLLFLESQYHFHLISAELQPTVINSDSCRCQMSGETGDGCVCFWWKWELELNVISLHCRSCYITTSPSSSCTKIMNKK